MFLSTLLRTFFARFWHHFAVLGAFSQQSAINLRSSAEGLREAIAETTAVSRACFLGLMVPISLRVGLSPSSATNMTYVCRKVKSKMCRKVKKRGEEIPSVKV